MTTPPANPKTAAQDTPRADVPDTPAPAPAPAPAASDAGDAGRLQYFPVAAFTIVMGLAGTAVAWHHAARAIGTPEAVAKGVSWLAAGSFVAVAGAYAVKIARHLQAVRAEWRHPAKLAFVPTASIALVILALALLGQSRPVSAVLWWTGAGAQLALTLHVLRTWLADPRFVLGHIHPAWFIPMVGNLVVPLAGAQLAPAGISWLFFSVGLVYWLALLPLVLGRLVLGGVLPNQLAPTLAIMIAPPSVAALAWVSLGGRWSDPGAQILLNITIFQVLLLTTQASALRRLPFTISFWAFTFPLAAAASALLGAGHAGLGRAYLWLGGVTLTALSAIVTGLGVRTLVAVRRSEICRPDRP